MTGSLVENQAVRLLSQSKDQVENYSDSFRQVKGRIMKLANDSQAVDDMMSLTDKIGLYVDGVKDSIVGVFGVDSSYARDRRQRIGNRLVCGLLDELVEVYDSSIKGVTGIRDDISGYVCELKGDLNEIWHEGRGLSEDYHRFSKYIEEADRKIEESSDDRRSSDEIDNFRNGPYQAAIDKREGVGNRIMMVADKMDHARNMMGFLKEHDRVYAGILSYLRKDRVLVEGVRSNPERIDGFLSSGDLEYLGIVPESVVDLEDRLKKMREHDWMNGYRRRVPASRRAALVGVDNLDEESDVLEALEVLEDVGKRLVL